MQKTDKTLIHTALLCEAISTIQYLKLIKNKDYPYLYENKNYVLLVSGIGKENTLKTLDEVFKNQIFKKAINIGIVGCKDKTINIGTLCCPTHNLTNILHTTLSTKDFAIENKEDIKTTLVDMESKYFFQKCEENCINEIYCFKVVSDYLDAKIPKKEFVTSLIQKNMQILKEYL